MCITTEQALASYHAAYDNHAYHALCDELVWLLGAGSDLSDDALRQTPDYLVLTNLLIHTALEICGHPAYHGEGWQLATSLHAVTTPRRHSGALTPEDIHRFFQQVDGYLGIYRAAMRQQVTATVSATALDLARQLTDTALQHTTTLPHWQGRTAYHLTAASAGLLHTAHILLAQPFSPSRAGYAAEKLRRACHDLAFALHEIVQFSGLDAALPAFFTRAAAAFNPLKET